MSESENHEALPVAEVIMDGPIPSQEPIDQFAAIQSALQKSAQKEARAKARKLLLNEFSDDELCEELSRRHQNLLTITIDDGDGPSVDHVAMTVKGDACLLIGHLERAKPALFGDYQVNHEKLG